MRDPVETYMNLVPMVVEQTNRGERAYDIFSRLLKERIMHTDTRRWPVDAGVLAVLTVMAMYEMDNHQIDPARATDQCINGGVRRAMGPEPTEREIIRETEFEIDDRGTVIRKVETEHADQ